MADFKFSREFDEQIKRQAVNYIVKYSSKRILQQFEDIKNKMIQEFLNHPVTKEINAGLYSSNISQTLSAINNDGNLFTFIGFDISDDPIAPIENVLSKIQIDIIKTYNTVSINIKYPTIDEIWNVTPMPWQEGRSWAKGIESGISGLNYYFHLKKASEKSRSTEGVQLHRARTNARYIPTKYITELLKKYRTIFSSKYARNKSVFVNVD
jgi:ribosomal protein S17E